MKARALTLLVSLLLVLPALGLPGGPTRASDGVLETGEVSIAAPGLYLVPNDLLEVGDGFEKRVGGLDVVELHSYGEASLARLDDPASLPIEIQSRITPLHDTSVLAYGPWVDSASRVDLGDGGDGYYVIAFQAPVDEAWQAAMKDADLRIVDTAFPYAVVVRGNGEKVQRVLELTTTTKAPAVVGAVRVPREARLDPDLYDVLAGNKAETDLLGLRRSGDGRMVVRAIGYADQNVKRLVRQVGEIVDPASGLEGYGYPDAFLVNGPEVNDILARVPGVQYIELVHERKLLNNLAAKSGVLAIEDVWNSGYTGAGVAVNHNDGGIDLNGVGGVTAFPSGVVTATAGNHSGTDNAHGTHTAGSVAGRAISVNAPASTSGCGDLTPGLTSAKGMAYGATLNSNNLFDPGTTGKTTEDTMMKYGQDNGSQLSTNSWGYISSYTYGSQAVTIDRAVRDADTTETGQQPLTILFAAGNDGSGAGTVGNPGTGKNAITVGASYNVRCGSYTSGAPGTFTGNLNTVVDFSGRGPSQGRVKPDIVATGANVLSVASDDSLADHSWDQTWTGPNYELMPGTSMACPIAAGAAAVFFQYYKATQGGAFPSPALAKAALINGAVAMSGYTYENTASGTYAQGWGRLNLKNTVQGPSGGTIKYVEEQATGLTTGQSSSRTITVNSSGAPLKVTAVWTDPQGTSGSSAPLVNNLDLIVTSPTGTVYRGNRFTGVWSTANPGSTTDTANNVENVFVQSPATGTWTIEVRSANTAQNVAGKTGQDFALVYSGDVTDGGTPTPNFSLSASPSSVTVTQGSSGTSTITCAVSGGFNAAVALSASGVPSGATASFSPTSIAAPGSGTSTLTLNSGTAAAGTYTVTVTGTGGSLTRTTTVTFTVNSSGGSATPLPCGGSINGALATTDPRSNVRGSTYYADLYSFTPTTSGSATITLNSSAFDAWLVLKSSATATTALAQDDDGNGGTNSRIVYTVTAGTTYYLEATSYSANATGAYTIALTCPTVGGTELVTNGGFETTGSWTFATYSSRTTGSPQAGTYKAQQLGRGTTTSTNFWQTISGFNGTSKTLRFYLKMTSAEGTSTAYDYLRVRIYNSSGTLVSTLGTYSNVNKNTYANWTLVTLTIPASSAVANYRLRFDASEDSSLQTTFFVDSVSIQ